MAYGEIASENASQTDFVKHPEEVARLAYEEYAKGFYSIAAICAKFNLSPTFFKSWLIMNGKQILKGRRRNPDRERHRPRLDYRLDLLIHDFGYDAVREALEKRNPNSV